MANIKSAKKRILVNKRQKNENRLVKATLNTEIRAFKKMLSDGKVAEAKAQISALESDINSAASKGVLHQNNASRKISRLHLALNKAEAKNASATVTEVKVEEVKAEEPAKKTTAKKETAEKKTVAKKTTKKSETTEEPAKKTATKKTTKKATAKDAE